VIDSVTGKKELLAIIRDGNLTHLRRLEHSGREGDSIAALYPGARVFKREQALEDTLKALDLKPFRYFHCATHSIIDAETPELSMIILTLDKDSTEDGLVHLYEIFDLDLNADLVVLSACETGLGKLVKGEGMVGFTRALMYAGTPTVILSLWSVADQSTANLFIDYYKGLKAIDGRDKHLPLREAQLKMIEAGGKFSNPYFWAPFVLIGER